MRWSHQPAFGSRSATIEFIRNVTATSCVLAWVCVFGFVSYGANPIVRLIVGRTFYGRQRRFVQSIKEHKKLDRCPKSLLALFTSRTCSFLHSIYSCLSPFISLALHHLLIFCVLLHSCGERFTKRDSCPQRSHSFSIAVFAFAPMTNDQPTMCVDCKCTRWFIFIIV